MDQKQFDVVLTDAELRLRRLKMLYEMWFMGIERMEPATPRKELEEMLARLRKEQVSNTAQRFRLQQLVQRHVSFSTHWRRIGRQIEEGTYQRDVIRAQRLRAQRDLSKNSEAELDVSYDVDLDIDMEDVLGDAERAADAASIAAAAKPESNPTTLAAPVKSAAAKPAPATTSVAPAALRPPLPLGTTRAAAGASIPPPLPPPSAARVNANSDTSHEERPAEARRSAAPRAISPFALPSAGSVRPKPLEPPKAPAPPPPLVSQTPAAKPTAVAAKAQAPAPAAPAKPRPTASSATAQAAANTNAADGGGGGFSNQDMERVYTQYIAARARNAERTDNVKRESLEKTIRGMLPQLAQKHAGKKIDFDIVVKDGKVALKPISK